MKEKIVRTGLLVLGVVLLLFSCVREEWFAPSGAPNRAFTVNEAKEFFKKNITAIKQFDLGNEHTCTDPTHHHPATKSDAEKKTITPEWSKAIQVSTDKSVILNIPPKRMPICWRFWWTRSMEKRKPEW